MEERTHTLSNVENERVWEENTMKPPLAGLALALSVALVTVLICALLLSWQAGSNQHTWSEEIEAQPAWVSCGISLECLT